jgi:hypothetical protein
MRTLLLLAVLAGASLLPANLPAQATTDLKYTTVTRAEFGGTFGRIARIFGAGRPIEETVWYSGPRQRTDRGQTSTVIDAAAGTVLEMQHTPRTYWLWSFGEPLFTVEFGDSLAQFDPDSLPRAKRQPRTRYEVSLATERGRRDRIVGLEAQQVFMTLTITGETYNEVADSVERGTLVVLSELWTTDQFPAEARDAFDKAWAERTIPALDSVELARMRETMERIYEEDPRLRIAVTRLDSALAAVSGTALKVVSHYVAVPDGVRFDRAAVLRDAERTLTEDVAAAAARGAVNEGRRTLGRIAGVSLGGERAPRPEQVVIMRTRYEVTALSTAPIPPDTFQPPANYTRRTPGGE